LTGPTRKQVEPRDMTLLRVYRAANFLGVLCAWGWVGWVRVGECDGPGR
jgi:hypothetical protein